jgi:hypothetical protein
MPHNMVETKKDEGAWKRAKARAAKQGHSEDWPYVVSIFQSMTGKGTAKGPLGPMVDVLRKATMTTAPAYDTPSGMAKLVVIQGLRVNIEQVPGDMRHGRMMSVGYGDIAGTMASDGEPFDCYIGQNKDAELVYVIDQLGPDGQIDEHKAMVGFDISEDAARAYCSQMGSNKMGGMVALRGPDLARYLANNPDVSAEPFADLVFAAGCPMVQVWAPMFGIGQLASPSVIRANGGA